MSAPYIPTDASGEELRTLALDYNWDDGFEFPRMVADHPNCDLAVALELFWLAGADEVYLGEAERNAYNRDWFEYSELICSRILEGRYSPGSANFVPALTQVQVHNLRKKGLPDVFLSPVCAD